MPANRHNIRTSNKELLNVGWWLVGVLIKAEKDCRELHGNGDGGNTAVTPR